MILRKSQFNRGYWYSCPNYPGCSVTMSIKTNGDIISTLADDKTKILRKEAHRLCEQIWGEWNSEYCDKKSQYDWLKENTRTGHIGTLEAQELEDLIDKILIKIGEIYFSEKIYGRKQASRAN